MMDAPMLTFPGLKQEYFPLLDFQNSIYDGKTRMQIVFMSI